MTTYYEVKHGPNAIGRRAKFDDALNLIKQHARLYGTCNNTSYSILLRNTTNR